MKIALCLHGMFSSLHDPSSNGYDGFKYIKETILNNNVDVYIHSWQEELKGEIEKLYKPVKVVYEKPKDFSNLIEQRGLHTTPNPPRSPETIMSHFYSVQESIKLIDGEYDVVIKSRFDLGRINRLTSGPGKHNPFPVQCINFNTSYDMSKLYMANWDYFDDGPADMWFYSSQNNMDKLRFLYDKLVNQYMFLDSDYAKSLNNKSDIANAVKLYKWFYQDVELWDKRIALNTEWK